MSADEQTPSQDRLTIADAIQTYLADWKSGQPCDLEPLLARIDAAERSQALRSLLIVDFRRRIEIGERPTEREYLQRFPNDLASVAEVLEMFPDEARQTVDLDAPAEITGYGSEFQAIAAEFRAQVFANQPPAAEPSNLSTAQSFPLQVAAEASPTENTAAPITGSVDINMPASSSQTTDEDVPFRLKESTPRLQANPNSPDLGKRGDRASSEFPVEDVGETADRHRATTPVEEHGPTPLSLIGRLMAGSLVAKPPAKRKKRSSNKVAGSNTEPLEQISSDDSMNFQELVVPVLYPLLGLGFVIVLAYLVWLIMGPSIQPAGTAPSSMRDEVPGRINAHV